jgi:hypothetical protein
MMGVIDPFESISPAAIFVYFIKNPKWWIGCETSSQEELAVSINIPIVIVKLVWLADRFG